MMNKEALRKNYEEAIWTLAAGVSPESLSSLLVTYEQEDDFEACEGIRLAIDDYLMSDVKNCKMKIHPDLNRINYDD